MIHLDPDQLAELNRHIARLFGFRHAIVRPVALDVVLASSRSASGPGDEALAAARTAAALLHGLIVAQPFADGNKRTAWHAARVFLAVNGWEVHHRPDETAALVRAVGVRALELDGVAEWLLARMEKGAASGS